MSGGGEVFSSAVIPNGISSTPVSKEKEAGSTNEGTMSSNPCVSFMNDCIHSLFLSLEEGTGSSPLVVIGSMVGLLLLLITIVGIVFLLVM